MAQELINQMRQERRVELQIKKVSALFRREDTVMDLISVGSSFSNVIENAAWREWYQRLVLYMEEHPYMLRNDIDGFARELVGIGEEDRDCSLVIDFILEQCI
jgi:hypothetical protein